MKSVVLRFMACSDLHYTGSPDCVEKTRFEEGLRQLYAYADSQAYPSVDAVYIVGDFAQDGTLAQMKQLKESLDGGIRPGTAVNLSMASHEYHEPHGEEGARRFFAEVFGQDADTHRVIRGHHFISVTTTDGNRFHEPQFSFIRRALAEARADTPEKAIFFFQHPDQKNTVYGSIDWGNYDLITTLMNTPQVIDFSGHSHAPANDPRSIHQEHFTSVGLGSFRDLELDEFDKIYGTFPPDRDIAAQMQIVEAFDDGSVWIRPYDVIAGRFFHDGWLVEKPWDPDSFVYTRAKRIREAVPPCFPEEASLSAEQTGDGLRIAFDHADGGGEDVNDYLITVRDKGGYVARRFSVWSPYYLSARPEKMTLTVPPLGPGDYTVTVRARGFWYNESENVLTAGIGGGADAPDAADGMTGRRKIM